MPQAYTRCNAPRCAQITVVDSHTFIKEYSDRNPVAMRPDLGGDDSAFRPVVDLLVEQVEVADYVVLNKVDLLGEANVPELEAMVRGVNPLCEVSACSHGEVRRHFESNSLLLGF
jgi:G3E family GTPase